VTLQYQQVLGLLAGVAGDLVGQANELAEQVGHSAGADPRGQASQRWPAEIHGYRRNRA